MTDFGLQKINKIIKNEIWQLALNDQTKNFLSDYLLRLRFPIIELLENKISCIMDATMFDK